MINKLEVDSVRFSINGRTILSGIYLSCQSGDIIGVYGRNGQGKSSLFNIIFGTLTAENKNIRINGRNINSPKVKQSEIAFLPQFPFLPGHLRPRDIFADFNIDPAGFLESFPFLEKSITQPVSELSRGEQRLVEVYTILFSPAAFVILDEPFSWLSPVNREIISSLLQQNISAKGIILTDHHFHEVFSVCNKHYLLAESKIHIVNSLQQFEEKGYLPITK